MKDKWDLIEIICDEVNRFAEANKNVDLKMNVSIHKDSMGYYKVDII